MKHYGALRDYRQHDSDELTTASPSGSWRTEFRERPSPRSGMILDTNALSAFLKENPRNPDAADSGTRDAA